MQPLQHLVKEELSWRTSPLDFRMFSEAAGTRVVQCQHTGDSRIMEPGGVQNRQEAHRGKCIIHTPDRGLLSGVCRSPRSSVLQRHTAQSESGQKAQMFHGRRWMNGQLTLEKVLSIISHQGNADQTAVRDRRALPRVAQVEGLAALSMASTWSLTHGRWAR